MPINSEKSKEVEARLPAELRPIYQQMVQEYEFLTHLKYGRRYAAYDVLAQMVLAGWRSSAEPHSSSALKSQNCDTTRKGGK